MPSIFRHPRLYNYFCGARLLKSCKITLSFPGLLLKKKTNMLILPTWMSLTSVKTEKVLYCTKISVLWKMTYSRRKLFQNRQNVCEIIFLYILCRLHFVLKYNLKLNKVIESTSLLREGGVVCRYDHSSFIWFHGP